MSMIIYQLTQKFYQGFKQNKFIIIDKSPIFKTFSQKKKIDLLTQLLMTIVALKVGKYHLNNTMYFFQGVKLVL